MKLVNMIRTVGIGCAFTACGAIGGVADSSVSAAALMDSGATVLGQVRLITGDFSAQNNSPECLALRGKVFAKRKQVQVGPEWLSVTKTAEYSALDGHEKQFKDAGCKPDATPTQAACKDLEAQLEKDASALGQTPQWQTLDNNANWHDLQEDYTKAQKIDCLP